MSIRTRCGWPVAEDITIYTAYSLAYNGPPDGGGIPGPRLTYDSADPLILTAAEIKGQLSELLNRASEVPSDHSP